MWYFWLHFLLNHQNNSHLMNKKHHEVTIHLYTFIIFFTNSWILLKLHSNKNEHTYSKTRVCALGLTLGHSLFLSLSPRPSPSERRGGGGSPQKTFVLPGDWDPTPSPHKSFSCDTFCFSFHSRTLQAEHNWPWSFLETQSNHITGLLIHCIYLYSSGTISKSRVKKQQ